MAHYLYATFLAPVKRDFFAQVTPHLFPRWSTQLKTATILHKVRHSIPHTLTCPITSLSCLAQEGKPLEPHLQRNWQTFVTRTRPQSKHLIPPFKTRDFFLQAILHPRTPYQDLDSESVFEDIALRFYLARANYRRSPPSSQY